MRAKRSMNRPASTAQPMRQADSGCASVAEDDHCPESIAMDRALPIETRPASEATLEEIENTLCELPMCLRCRI